MSSGACLSFPLSFPQVTVADVPPVQYPSLTDGVSDEFDVTGFKALLVAVNITAGGNWWSYTEFPLEAQLPDGTWINLGTLLTNGVTPPGVIVFRVSTIFPPKVRLRWFVNPASPGAADITFGYSIIGQA